MSEFYIMNKDIVVAEFICSSEEINQIYITKVYHRDLLPISLKNGFMFNDWINSRLVLSHRKNVLEMFSTLGITNPESILEITKGISLNDTYWIKSVDSKKTWKSISPYSNPLNCSIADYSFMSDKQINGKFITHSPDFATSGQFPKCWKRINDTIYLIKGGSVGHAGAGNEPYSDIHAYMLANQLQIKNIPYEYIRYKNINATKCKNMCTEEIGIYPLSEAFPQIHSYDALLNQFKNNQKEFYKLIDMMLLDYLTLNTDRHFGNISIFVHNDTQELLGFTPIYDNNLAFLPTYLEKVDGTIEDYIANYGHINTSTGISFDDLFTLIYCKYVKNKLALLKHYKIQSPYKRVDIANQVLQRQLNRLRY